MRSWFLVLMLTFGLAAHVIGQQTPVRPFDVLNYAAHIEPDLAARTVAGRVTITFVARVDTLTAADLDAGDLVVETVRTGTVAQPFVKNGRRLRVSLTPPLRAGEQRSIDVVDHGAPRSGVQFHPERSRLRYEAVRSAGDDKPLVFPKWNQPTANDRTLVYHKGAYVLHLLREKLGEGPFWDAIRHYTRTHLDRSVTTRDFQTALEQSTGVSLSVFFREWVAF